MASQTGHMVDKQSKRRGPQTKKIEHMDDLYLKLIGNMSAYEDACLRGGMVDFAELLLRAHELWLKKPELLKHYQTASPLCWLMSSRN